MDLIIGGGLAVIVWSLAIISATFAALVVGTIGSYAADEFRRWRK